VTTTAANAFLQRARHEAERYGTDPWVFVRELLQNARDAGAHKICFETSSEDGRDRVCCRDDGSGMTFEHAERYLFSLYASSKRGRPRSAGRFGIGFWSVLRFEPTEIVVRSQPRRGEAWQVCLDGGLERVRRQPTSLSRGTEVVLERPAATDDLEKCLTISCRHRKERPLDVRVNGRLVRVEPQLPPPSLSFRRRGLRGTVGLGREPRAEIFAHGLRVRDAATLDELLVEGQSRRPTLAGTTEGLAPRVIIDSRDLEVMMARGDAREDRALRRLVAVGHRELNRLVRTELDRHTRMSLPARLVASVREWWSTSRFAKVTGAVVVAAVVGFFAWKTLIPWLPGRASEGTETVTAPFSGPSPPVPYRNLSDRYRGPDVESIASAGPTVDLRYRPPDRGHLFAAMWVTGLSEQGRLEPVVLEVAGSYEGAACGDGCLEIEVVVDAPAGLLLLPVATGHLVDPHSVRLDDRRLPVLEATMGQPAVRLDRPRTGTLRYRTGPGPSRARTGAGAWPKLPQGFADFSRELQGLPASSRALEAAEFVRRRIAYDTSRETAERHRQAREEEIGLFDRAASIGAGDCDVQNALVAALIEHSGLQSRLAVGWIGADGRARSGLHAWAEYLGEDGRWWAVDASVDGSSARSTKKVSAAGEVDSGRPRSRLTGWLPMTLFTTLVLAAAAALLSRRRWRRSFRAGGAEDLVGLVHGAAVRPRAFEGIHSLFSRRLLGLVSGRSISLARAADLARAGRLACGSRRSRLSRRGARGGGVVLDLDRAESAAAATALAAVDLDNWHELLGRSHGDGLTACIERRLAAVGEPCRIVIADQVGLEMAVLEGAVFGLGENSRWVVVDAGSRLWKSVCRWAEHRPARAALLLADIVVHRTGAPSAVRQRSLSQLALEALHEAAEAL
jgi:transglutaminase-like putative cysteine protease